MSVSSNKSGRSRWTYRNYLPSRGATRRREHTKAADAVCKEYIDVDSVYSLGEEHKVGELTKTSLSKTTNKVQGPPRKRRFRLTPEALQYFNQFSQGKVSRSFPLTAIEDVQYDADTPTSFKLVFRTFVMVLEAQTTPEAMEWVDAIRHCWMAWNPDSNEGMEKDKIEEKEESDEELTGMELTPGPDSVFLSAKPQRVQNPLDLAILSRTQTVPEKQLEESPFKHRPKEVRRGIRPRSHTDQDRALRHMSSEDQTPTLERRQRKTLRHKLRLLPKLEKQIPIRTKNEEEEAYKILHNNFTMIKYPRSRWSIPAEQIVKVDKDNLHIFWRKNLGSRFSHKSSLRLDAIVEVRLGQRTDGFERFPYEEVEKQSFSLIFENTKGKYAVLDSVNFICDHPDHFEEWIRGLESLNIGPQSAMFPNRYENTDPCLLWLKQIWTLKQEDRELRESDAMKIGYRINPVLAHDDVRQLIIEANYYQHDESHGKSLKWNGFVLFYNLMCGEVGRLYEIYSKYAKTHKRLGMTLKEFELFLMEECNWSKKECGIQKLRELIAFHDHHHRSFKKFVSSNKPERYTQTVTLLSYAGLLSFIRSNQNAAVNPLHNTVYQDMTQPMSHYFINSSHNTYLETDQIKGRSTLDAYIRALLQGSRCIEIDCWDNTLGAEPVVYHGFTFTTKLQLRDVVTTIRDYAFRMSHYPLIISIENHCNQAQQARMAQIFREELENNVARSMLATENLVDGEEMCRRRLPSPQELQGKIILKASIRHSAKVLAKSKSTAAVVKDNIDLDQRILKKEPTITMPNTPTTPTTPVSPTTKQFEENHNEFNRGSTRRQARHLQREVRRSEGNILTQEDDQELDYTETSMDLQSLIIYCRSTRIKPWSWKEQRATSICQMFSFSEVSADQHCDRSAKEMLACTERQFVRTYPRGARIYSTNYDPLSFWNHGIQMVALNFQYPDIHMHLNQGRFRQNGGCGYVLKPAIMRRGNPGTGAHPFDPLMTEPHPLVPSCHLEIELLSGQNLSLDRKINSLMVDIHTYGLQADTVEMSPRAEASNSFWPQWPSGVHLLSHHILMPELCLVYFRVNTSSSQLLGQNCISLTSLQPGLKFIQLRKATGELMPETGLFVRIKTTYEDQPKTTAPPPDLLRLPKKSSPRKLVHQDRIEQSLRYNDVTSPPQSPPTLEIEEVDAGEVHEMEEQVEELNFLVRHSTLMQHDVEDDGGSMMNLYTMSENSSIAPLNFEGSGSFYDINEPHLNGDRMIVTAEIEY